MPRKRKKPEDLAGNVCKHTSKEDCLNCKFFKCICDCVPLEDESVGRYIKRPWLDRWWDKKNLVYRYAYTEEQARIHKGEIEEFKREGKKHV